VRQENKYPQIGKTVVKYSLRWQRFRTDTRICYRCFCFRTTIVL